MAQWTYRSGSYVSAGNASGNALSVNKPVGCADGDLIVYVVYWESGTNTVTPPSGLVSAHRGENTGTFLLEVFTKLASGEGASYTFTPAVNTQWRTISGGCYSNGTGAGPWKDLANSAQGDAITQPSQTAPSITTTSANDLLVWGYGSFAGTPETGAPSGAVTTLRGVLGGIALGDAARASAGATGTTIPSVAVGTQDYVGIHAAFVSDTGAAVGLIPAPLKWNRFPKAFMRRTP